MSKPPPTFRQRLRLSASNPTSVEDSHSVEIPAEDLEQSAPGDPVATGDYAVGYCRPPVATRFGAENGNRPGRKKGSTSLIYSLDRELQKKVSLIDGGKQRTFSKQDVLARNIVNGAIAGKAQPLRLLFPHLLGRAEPGMTDGPADADFQLDDDETAALVALAALLGPAGSSSSGEGE